MPICKSTKITSSKKSSYFFIVFVFPLSFILANNVESNVVLPQLLKVSLEPKNEMAFCRVQKLAQNPYLMIDLLGTHTIKHLISYLENKWKERRLQFVSNNIFFYCVKEFE